MAREHAKSPALAGRLQSSPVPELLAYAHNHRFTGALVLESEQRARSGVFFEKGAVLRARASGIEQQLARRVLREAALSGDDLVVAARFARESGRDIFMSVDELGLLPPERLEVARAEFVHQQVRALVELPADSVYGFFPELDTLRKLPGPSRPLPALNLIIDCILAEPSLERCRQQLEPFRNDRMTLLEPSSPDAAARPALIWPVVARLSRAPHSFEELRLLNLVEERELVACMYALRLTRRVIREGNPTRRPSWPSRVARRTSSQGFRAVGGSEPPAAKRSAHRDTLPEVGYRPPESEVPRRRLSDAEQKRYWQEQNAESKALEAWAIAEGSDAAGVEKATLIVEKALAFFPDNPRIHFYAGCLYRRARRYEEAANEFRRVLTLDPDNLEARHELDSLLRRSDPPSKGVFGRLLKKR